MALLRLSQWTMLFSYCSWFRDRTFASDCQVMNSVPNFGRESSCGKPVGQNGLLTGSVRSSCVGGLCRGAGRRPSKVSLTKTIGKSV
ncbi:hypothetical protein CDL15_Pgr021935 [Punica granatum]|uniref:Uncharacterized protein n=1 Tax=Punica granatum TaxID=22663 RepID=A0A218XI12_PUNGR|nr:hypothetical protein CDL15_Pgr021935 [Punica granatum]